MQLADYLPIILGLVIAVSAVMDWPWLMESRRSLNQAQFLGGRGRLRVMYIVIGVVLVALGVLRVLGVLA